MNISAQNYTPKALVLAGGLLGLLFSTLSAAPQSQDSLETRAVRRMEERYRSVKTLQANFLERYTENGRTVRVEAGTAYFRRLGKMRWEYESPEKNLFLVDGKTAWFYVPADHTVTRVPAKDSADWRTPLALLAGEMKASRVCARIEQTAQEKPESSYHIVVSCVVRGSPPAGKSTPADTLEPDASSSGDTVFFEVARDSGELSRIVIRDKGGVGVEFRFSAWRMDPPVAESLFHFSPPLGVAIVSGDLAQGGTGSHP